MTEHIKFIKGRYNPAEAADVLLSLINDKIKFHTVKSLNLRQEEPNSHGKSDDRIVELKQAKKIVENLVVKAHKNGLELEIDCTVEINIVNNKSSKLKYGLKGHETDNADKFLSTQKF